MKKFKKNLMRYLTTALVAVLMLSSIPTLPVMAAPDDTTITVNYYLQDKESPGEFRINSTVSRTVKQWREVDLEMEALPVNYTGWYLDVYGENNFTEEWFDAYLSSDATDTVNVYARVVSAMAAQCNMLWESEHTERYSDIMSVEAAKYYLSSQPDSALVLTTQVNLTSDMLSPNYSQGVVDLPRLSSSYYYEVSGNSAFYLSSGLYPALCWTPAAQGSYCTLTIRSEADASSLYSCMISFAETLPGVDVSSFVDCSKDLTKDMVSDNNCAYFDMSTEIYDATAHTCSIIMPEYRVVPFSVTGLQPEVAVETYNSDWVNAGASVTEYNIDEEVVRHNRAVLSVGGSTTSTNIKDYTQYYQSPYYSKALLFQGSKSDSCTYDTNTGAAVTRTTASDTDNLYYFIATNDNCYWGAVTLDTTSADELTTVDASAKPVTWLTGEYSSLKDLNEDIVAYDDWWSSSYVGGLTMRGKYEFSPTYTISNKNIYATTLMFAGVDAHLGTLSIEDPPRYTTISYYYQKPDKTEWTKLGEDVRLLSSEVTLESLATLPAITDFTAKGWFTDTSLKVPVSLSSLVNENADTNIRLYSGYDYSGGEYTVTFYNDVTGSKAVSTFEKRYQPTLPANPSPQAGYAFRCWRVVSDYESVIGTDYTPDTFKPEANTDYKFKTMWDVKGIITKVLTDKTRYYLGETVDKSTLQVYVQIDNDGTQRILEDDEYTMNGNTVSKVGVNQFTITFTETGATGICEVSGMEDTPLGISAVYTGGDINVGTELNTGMFKVTQNYLSGKTEDITEFSISPKTVELIGDNTITITTATKSCTITVKGLATNTDKDAVMQKITAIFVGTSPTVGDKVKASQFNVTAEYSDKTKRTLPAEEFTITPEKYTTAGTFYVRIECNGLVANPSVTVKAATVTPTPTPIPTPTPTPTPSKGNSGNSGSGNSNGSGTSNNTTVTTKPSTSTSTSNKNNSNSNTSTVVQEQSLASPLYIGGATILTKDFGTSNATPKENTVDIMQLIKDTDKDADSLTVKLVNGRDNNDITPAMFKELRKKKLVLYIEMMDPEDTDTLVARWAVNTAAMESDTASINPNISFETVNKESDKVLKIDINTTNYPKGTTLNVYPDLYTYGSGQTIRLYEVTAQGQVSTLKSTFTWLDVANKIPVDVYTCYHYALSDATTAYSLSDNLLEEIVSTVTTPENDVPAEEDIIIGGNPSEEPEWDWDYPTETPTVDPESKSFPWLLVLLIGGGLLLIGGVVIVIIVMSGKKSKRASTSDYTSFDVEDDSSVYDDSADFDAEADDEDYLE